MIFRRLAAIASLAAVLAASAAPSFAQQYPTNNPGYIPTAVLAPTAFSAAGDLTFVTNGVDSVVVRVSGSGTGIAANIQGTTERGSSPTWTNLPAEGMGSPSALSIAGTGLWRVNTAGLAAVRFHLTAVTGSITVAMSGSPGAGNVLTRASRRQTYSAAVTALSPASSATDFITLTGAAGKTIRLTRAECSGISTANATATVNAVIRSTANSAGTSSAMTAVPHDSGNAAASGTALSYTANPTTGTLVGIIRSGKLTTNTAATSTVAVSPLVWTFGEADQQEVALRGTGEVFALNANGASFTSGASLNCSITWTEE